MTATGRAAGPAAETTETTETLSPGLGAEVVEVGDGVHAYVQRDGSWWVNTTGFVAGDDGVVAIDACATRARTEALLAAIEATAGRPAEVLVNTHHHGDHTFGNELFTSATIVGHTRCRESMLAETVLTHTPPLWDPMPQWGGLRVAPPTVTFDDGLDLWAGGRLVQLRHVGRPAHTEGDVVAWVPDDRVLFAGDLVFHEVTPMLMGSVPGYLEALDVLRGYGARVLVGGHGSPCGPETLDVHEQYARMVLQAALAGLARGDSPLEAAARTDLGAFAALPDSERIVINLHRAYADLTTGGEFELPAAFADAVTFHGGPLRCVV